MFDSGSATRPVGAAAREAWVASLGQDDERCRRLLTEIEAREQAVNALQAEQLLAVAEYAEARARLDLTTLLRWDEGSRRVCAAELAAARRVGLWSADSHLAAALTLIEDAPRVLERLEEGAITLQAARAVSDEITTLDPTARPQADEVIAAEVGQVLPGQARGMARARCMEIDPDAVMDRAVINRAQRYVQVRPSSMVGLATLSAPLPVEQAVACWGALDHHARALHAEGDERTVSQIMADTLVERVTGQSRCTDVPVEIQLVMTDSTLFGAGDRPAHLPGHGPVPAALARTIAAKDGAWIRRLLTNPIDDTVTTIESRRRRFRGVLRDFVRIRDQRCRGVGCTSTIRDDNHIDEYYLGGVTSADNGAGLCQRCHHLLDLEGVGCEAVEGSRAQKSAGAAALRWNTPVGRPMVTLAPPVLGHGTSTLAQLDARRRRRDEAACPHRLSPRFVVEYVGPHHAA